MITFYRETKFKETPIGKMPKDWEVVRLGEIARDLYYGITAKATKEETKLRMLRTTDIKNYSTNWDALPFCEITEKRKKLDKFFLRKDDLIIARAGTIGVSLLVDKKLADVIFGSYLIKVRLKNDIYPKFMHYFFQSHLYWRHINASQAGSTLKNINLPILKSLKIPLPPLPEQRKIAEVLSTVDQAIQKVDEIIAKTERLKKGLMQELLTKGIGHKEFKYSKELGCEIPKEWKVVKLGDFIQYQKGRKPRTLANQREANMIPYLSAETLRTGVFNKWTRKTENLIEVNRDDLVLIWDGFYCGDAFIGFEGVLSSTMIKIEPKKPSLDRFFLFYFLKSRAKILNTQIAGMYLKHVSKSVFESLKLPLPPLSEQQKIAEILSTVDKKLEIERKEKAKLERIKQGLMDLLLTGKIRVKV